MNNSKSFASLSPVLLARKGGAKPAMRAQVQPLQEFQEAAARQMFDDLGWNDMGQDRPERPLMPQQNPRSAPITLARKSRPANVKSVVPAAGHRKEDRAESLSMPREPQQSAPARKRRTALTVRLDPDRHLKLRLAAIVEDCSAQQIMLEALDRALDEMHRLDELTNCIAGRNGH